MSTLSEKIEAIEKIGAGDQINQTLDKWIDLHLQKYQKQMADLQNELTPFEKKFGITSEEGHQKYEMGALGDDADVMEWMGLYDNMRLYQERVEALKTVAHL